MKEKNDITKPNKTIYRSAKECSYTAVFVALLIASQLAFASIPGVEIVTLLFVSYAFCLGAIRGMLSATLFSLLRQIIFGFNPTVLVLYLVYYNLLTLIFGLLGKRIQNPLELLWLIIFIACVCTIAFTMIDNILTTFWYGYTERAAKIYFKASISFMVPQVICTAISVGVLFLPLVKIFSNLKKRLL